MRIGMSVNQPVGWETEEMSSVVMGKILASSVGEKHGSIEEDMLVRVFV